LDQACKSNLVALKSRCPPGISTQLILNKQNRTAETTEHMPHLSWWFGRSKGRIAPHLEIVKHVCN